MKQFDIVIVGAGAVGNAAAREILKRNKDVTVGVLEKEPDTAFGISGRNSGVLHAGFNNKPGSFMARLCVQGSEGFEKEAEELEVEFKRTGKLIIARFEEDIERLHKLKNQGEENGVRELRVVEGEELEEMVGYPAGVAALWSGRTGIFDPFQYTVALAESAASLGAAYCFGREVVGITAGSQPGGFKITAVNHASGNEEVYHARVLVNSAGLFADEICRMAGIDDYKVYPCRGEYHILDRRQPGLPTIPIYPIPNEKEGGLGVHLTPSIHGNVLIGPSAEYLSEEKMREEYSTTRDVMDKLTEEGMNLFPGMDLKNCIRSFSGVRPKLVSETQGGYADFVIEASKKVPGLIQLIGIESPGLTSSIPIGRMVAKMSEDILALNGGDISNGGAVPLVREKTADAHAESGSAADAQAENNKAADAHARVETDAPAFKEPGDQKMLCRCEGITEAAVLAAYDRILSIGAIPTVKGLKNRTRVTMGNCQGSFCTINIIELLQKMRNVDPLDLLWNGFGSRIFEGRVKK